jgi:hypothetical protein
MKMAWHLPRGTAKALFSFPPQCGGYPAPDAATITAQELISHIQRCAMHDDSVSRQLMTQLREAEEETLCSGLQDLVRAAPTFTDRQTRSNTFLRLAVYLHRCYLTVRWDVLLNPLLLSWGALLNWVGSNPSRAHFHIELPTYSRVLKHLVAQGYTSPLSLPSHGRRFCIPLLRGVDERSRTETSILRSITRRTGVRLLETVQDPSRVSFSSTECYRI